MLCPFCKVHELTCLQSLPRGLPAPMGYRYHSIRLLLATAISDVEKCKPHSMWGLISQSLLIGAPGYVCAPPLACYCLWRGRRDAEPELIDASHQLYILAVTRLSRVGASPQCLYTVKSRSLLHGHDALRSTFPVPQMKRAYPIAPLPCTNTASILRTRLCTD